MSAEDVKAKARQTVKSVSELLDSVQKAVNDRLSKEAPKVVNSLDKSFNDASKALTDTLKTVDQKSRKEQAELLKAYRSFLQKQTEIVEKRMASMRGDDKSQSSQ